MIDPQRHRRRAVQAALEKASAAVVEKTGTGWTFTLANGIDLHGNAAIDADWLLLDLPLDSATAFDPLHADLLRWNASLPGCVKFGLTPSHSPLRLRAELPLDALPDPAQRIAEACGGFRLGAVCFETSTGEPLAPVTQVGPQQDAPIDLRPLCDATQWPYVERPSGELMVQLDVPSRFHQAVIESVDGGVRARVALGGDGGSPAECCQRALAALLLRTAAFVRMARPLLAHVGGHLVPHFEVVFSDTPAAAELKHGLAALSVACRVAAEEVAVLQQNETIARAYLEHSSNNQQPTPVTIS